MAGKRSWDLDQERKAKEFPFHSYIRPTDGEALMSRLMKLEALAADCGESAHWGLRVVVERDPQDWIVFGFKSHDHKMAFERGAEPIMAQTPVVMSSGPLPNGLADPNRDLSYLDERKKWRR